MVHNKTKILSFKTSKHWNELTVVKEEEEEKEKEEEEEWEQEREQGQE
jgi:hypothetical protein